ncbi:hypothetical protein BKI52_41405 [marine bacterium AO1-C]|nr:hypothetical protein BKI52_41405 [marine bacterium AO1-C]
MHKSIFIIALLIGVVSCKQPKNQETQTTPERNANVRKNSSSSQTQASKPNSNDPASQNLPKGPVKPQENLYKGASFETKVITGKENTFGYEITVTLNGKTQRIRQEHKPSVPGIRGFDTQEDAQKVADFVVNKIKTKGFPPTVTPEELKALGVIK